MENSIWERTQSLLLVFSYENDEQLRQFRLALDNLLNQSNVKDLIIIVNVPKEVDKNTLPPHFLIYYNSPNDYNFWGKLKDVQLEAELRKTYDMLLWFGSTEQRIFSHVMKVPLKQKVIVNNVNNKFDIHLNSETDEPAEMLNFVVRTLTKIASY